jgi:hypothetical protein
MESKWYFTGRVSAFFWHRLSVSVKIGQATAVFSLYKRPGGVFGKTVLLSSAQLCLSGYALKREELVHTCDFRDLMEEIAQ